MSCGGSDFIANYYFSKGKETWETAHFRWISTTQTPPFTNAFLDATSYSGYLDTYLANIEMEALGNAAVINAGLNIYTIPYTSVLRPLDDYTSFVQNAKNIIIQSISFQAFDVQKSGSTYQNGSVNTAIDNTLASTTGEKYVKTGFFNVMPVYWQPNFFRPKFKIAGTNILNTYENTPQFTQGQGNNKAVLSIGEFLPYTADLNKPLTYPLNSGNALDQIQVEALCGQIVDVSGTFYLKRYPLICSAIISYTK